MNPEGDSLEQFYRNTTVAQNFAEEKKMLYKDEK